MGIYSKDRTMLSIDPMAEETSMPGYESAVDLYKILEETMSNDLIIFDSLMESEVSVVGLDEADSAKIDRRAKSLEKLLRAINVQLASSSAKIKSVCVGVNKKVNTFNEKKLAGIIAKYGKQFENNKDIMTSSHFAMKYNKEALECSDKEIAKFIKDADVAGKQLAKAAVDIAKKDAASINKNRNFIFKAASLEKYAEKFCCCCGEKKTVVSGNPFSVVKPSALVNEIKTDPKINFEKAVASMDAAFGEVSKQVNAMQANLSKNPEAVTAEDLATAHALAAIVNGLIKAYIHMINDAYKCYVAHTKECIKVYIAAANIKAKRVNESVEYRATIASLTEADIILEEYDIYMDIDDTIEDDGSEDVTTDEVIEDEGCAKEGCCKSEGCAKEGCVKDEACSKEACKEAAEPSKDEPVVENYLQDVELHHFDADKSLIECGVEICLMAESNWVNIVESIANNEYDTYCTAVAEGKLNSEALVEADGFAGLKEKAVASLKKIAEYLYGLFARAIANITNTITKYKFLTDGEAQAREEKGAEKLAAENATVSGFTKKINIVEDIYGLLGDIELLIDDISKNKVENAKVEAYKIFVGNDVDDFKKELFQRYIENTEIKIDKKLLDSSLETVEKFKSNKIDIKSVFDRVKKIINSSIASVKTMEDKEEAAKIIKQLHELASVVSMASSVALSAISKDFTTACKVVLTCYNAGGKKDKKAEGEAVNDAAMIENTATTTESIESIYGKSTYIK